MDQSEGRSKSGRRRVLQWLSQESNPRLSSDHVFPIVGMWLRGREQRTTECD